MLIELEIGTVTIKDSMEVFQKLKIEPPYDSGVVLIFSVVISFLSSINLIIILKNTTIWLLTTLGCTRSVLKKIYYACFKLISTSLHLIWNTGVMKQRSLLCVYEAYVITKWQDFKKLNAQLIAELPFWELPWCLGELTTQKPDLISDFGPWYLGKAIKG